MLAPYLDYLRERVTTSSELTATRSTREIRARGLHGPLYGGEAVRLRYQTGGCTQAIRGALRDPRPVSRLRWTSLPCVTEFTDEPGSRFSLVLGYSRHIFARFVMHQDLQICRMQAFAEMGGVPIEILYDRMKTAVTGEDQDGHIVYNRSLLAFAKHYAFHPKTCRP